MKKAYIVSSKSGDWQGLYIDGVLQCEGHSLRPDDILNSLNYVVNRIEKSDEFFEEHGGSCPSLFKQVTDFKGA